MIIDSTLSFPHSKSRLYWDTTSIQFVSSSSSNSSSLGFEKIFTFRVMLPKTRVIIPFCILIVTSIVAKNGRPKITGICELTLCTCSVYRTTNSTWNTNKSIWTRKSSRIPLGYLIERLANYSVILVGFNSPNPNY